MPQSISMEASRPATGGLSNHEQSPTLLDALVDHIGEYVTLYTGHHSFAGYLMEVTSTHVLLDGESEALEARVDLRVAANRVEAIEIVREGAR